MPKRFVNSFAISKILFRRRYYLDKFCDWDLYRNEGAVNANDIALWSVLWMAFGKEIRVGFQGDAEGWREEHGGTRFHFVCCSAFHYNEVWFIKNLEERWRAENVFLLGAAVSRTDHNESFCLQFNWENVIKWDSGTCKGAEREKKCVWERKGCVMGVGSCQATGVSLNGTL